MYLSSKTIAHIITNYLKSNHPSNLPPDLSEQMKSFLGYHSEHFNKYNDTDFWFKFRMCQSLLILMYQFNSEQASGLLRPFLVPISNNNLQLIFRTAVNCLQGEYSIIHNKLFLN